MSLTVLITGSSRGIGLGVAKHLASQGHNVILNSRKEIDESILKEFEEYGVKVGTAIGNISDFNVAKELIDAAKAEFGQIDVLINNAGITRDGLMMRMSEEDFNSVIQTNLNGTFNMCRHITPIMLKQKSGTIINLSSIVGVMGNAGQVNYAASKAGVIGLTKALARELSSRAITVNAIAPGFIETDMTDQLSDRVKDSMLTQIPLKRFGQVEEIAQTVDFLINNRYITGQVIEVNGGMNM
ncbi:3-oxoacyl-[acyl-carrier-protein] reductase [Fundicoccus ignavus]|uniref:3-oxoacyl-[acyl-carrier-protein] reductase n=1 Tax=Fundicoccus ignavus TaxID=2664442 RepID=A0A6I2GNV8_9LACT|nr:3-oxoacyl-[acyl-carrier-protein] reductase [Fundicoccus ignavus]MRI81889.1 3-oxoacyl-[acyl-carrier-protein] reductase [Fundicoccus ignavus]MRI85205.1 3-oxoacyl-[acyl-carrier-protein] reductase [Fundicoccus ignavus]MRJ48142.1 3-oxoacyl-[acyl-carrier-protein] reductase [Fundicoccus ignavus]